MGFRISVDVLPPHSGVTADPDRENGRIRFFGEQMDADNEVVLTRSKPTAWVDMPAEGGHLYIRWEDFEWV